MEAAPESEDSGRWAWPSPLHRRPEDGPPVNREQVQQHHLDVLRQNFTCWVVTFSLMLWTLLPTMLVIFLWLLISMFREVEAPCDVPLRWWVIVVCLNVAYHTNICGRGSVHSFVLKNVCRFDPESEDPAPCHVKLYNLLATALVFVWHCVGLHWVTISSTCKDTAPDFYFSVKVFSTFSIVFNIFVCINTVGLYTILMFMLRNGLLNSTNAAPTGTLELQKPVLYDAELFKDNKECCVCMADFDDQSEIRRTSCGHCFHETCLAGWLKVNRTCPLCRTDLTQATVPDVRAFVPGVAEDQILPV